MIKSLKLYESTGFDPYYNLAAEQYLLENAADDTCILYLWQNQNTVVIGRNQNAWKECRTTLLEKEGGHLARRLSGGGAVFHDLGNLNFTFLVAEKNYDLDRQLTVIQRACGNLGISVERSGRNDLLAEGRKFSGNAFYRNNGRAYHHGTLLVDTDMERMSRYLNPSKAKLQGKGVDSVRSRVVNLRELRPEITISELKSAMADAFSEVYELPCTQLTHDQLDAAALETICANNRSWYWNYGNRIPFSFSCESRFDWGEIQIVLQVESGFVAAAKIYTDAMDWSVAPHLERLLTGCRFTASEIVKRIASGGLEISLDICRLIEQQEI